MVYDLRKVAIEDRADRHNEDRDLLDIDRGSQVWLYLNRIKEGFARKLYHIWHEHFFVDKKCDDHAVYL